MERLDDMQVKQNGRTLEDILTNGYQLDSMAALSRGFNILGKDTGSYIGFTLLTFVISMVIGLIPIVSLFASLFVGPALHAGFSYYLKAYLHDDSSEFSKFFDGFKAPQIIQLALASFVTQIIVLAIGAIVILLFCGNILTELYENYLSLINPTDQDAQQAGLTYFLNSQHILGISTASLVAGLLSILYILTSSFIVFRQMSFWDAMEASRKIVMKKYLSFLGWLVVWIILLVISAIPCGLGLLFTYPAFLLSVYALYMQITEDESVLGS
jgi:hypothetical protein